MKVVKFDVVFVMKDSGMIDSIRDAQRLINQCAVSINNKWWVTDRIVYLPAEELPAVLKVGKRRFLRLAWNVEDLENAVQPISKQKG